MILANGQKVRGKLKNLVIENIGLVDAGANQYADMAWSKRAPPMAKVGETVTGSYSVVKFILPKKEPANG